MCAFQESEDCVSPKYHYFTAVGNIQDSKFKHFCIIDKRRLIENQSNAWDASLGEK